MRRPNLVFALLILLSSPSLLAQEEPRICNDGKPAADDGTCPEDYMRICADGQPAFEDGTCPEDAVATPDKTYFDVPFNIKANIDLAVVTMDDQEIGQTPLKTTARVPEGSRTLAVIFPGFEPFIEEIKVDRALSLTGITRSVELTPTNERAKELLSTEEGIQRFLASALTVDAYVSYQDARKIKTAGLIFLIGSGVSFAGMTAALIASENDGNAAVTLPLTIGTITFLAGVPTYVYGALKLNKAKSQRRNAEFQLQPPTSPPAPDLTEPASEPVSEPASTPDETSTPIP